MGYDADNAADDHADNVTTTTVQAELSPKPKAAAAVEEASTESGTAAAKEASPASTGRYFENL